ncbi:Lar family restriction alleviation protein [Bradyrhizobium sp. SZCCHNS3053]|uniref:Lar family restriction alleviation protein n=1 Tax=Bradyrhizobium sp. SZCCHNS3053 TaxID=3057322 RepID=UPI003966C329
MRASEVEHRFGEALKRCPFCHSADVGLWLSPQPHITCLDCGADGPLVSHAVREDLTARQYRALKLWNERLH